MLKFQKVSEIFWYIDFMTLRGFDIKVEKILKCVAILH